MGRPKLTQSQLIERAKQKLIERAKQKQERNLALIKMKKLKKQCSYNNCQKISTSIFNTKFFCTTHYNLVKREQKSGRGNWTRDRRIKHWNWHTVKRRVKNEN